MTVDAQSTYEFNIARIVRMAYQAAGLKSSGEPMSGLKWSQDLAMAMDFLEVELKALQAASILVRPIDFYDLSVVAGVNQYQLPGETLDLIGDAMWLATGDEYELPVVRVMRAVWMAYANKDALAYPSTYYADREAELTVYLYPTPSQGGRLRFQRHRLLANARNGSKTVDLERHWTKYLIAELGKWLAFCNNLDAKADKLGRESAIAKEEATSYSKERGKQTFISVHRTPWSR